LTGKWSHSRKSANVKTDKGVLGNENHGYHPDEPKPASE
jgi:hypothetical protein